MKKSHVIISLILLFSLVFLSGCEELVDLNKPDYIDVFVTCDVHTVLFPPMESMDDPQTLPAKYLQVNVEIIKAGGERVDGVVYSDSSGKTGSVSASFKLYREQPITCVANVAIESANAEYPEYTFNSDSKTIPWSEMYPANDFGDHVSKKVTLYVYGMAHES